MVQTEKGAARNEWITYMRTCDANYHTAKVLEEESGQSLVKGKPGKIQKKLRKARNDAMGTSHATEKPILPLPSATRYVLWSELCAKRSVLG